MKRAAPRRWLARLSGHAVARVGGSRSSAGCPSWESCECKRGSAARLRLAPREDELMQRCERTDKGHASANSYGSAGLGWAA